jgi:hypothetical protein
MIPQHRAEIIRHMSAAVAHQVGSRAGRASFAAQKDYARSLLDRVVDCVAELCRHLRRERIQALGTIQRYFAHGAIQASGNGGNSTSCLPLHFHT